MKSFGWLCALSLLGFSSEVVANPRLDPINWKGRQEVLTVTLIGGEAATVVRRGIRARRGDSEFQAKYTVKVPYEPTYVLRFEGYRRGHVSDVSFLPKECTQENWLAGRGLFGTAALFDALEGLHDDFEYFELTEPKTGIFRIHQGIERARSLTDSGFSRPDYDTRASYWLDSRGKLRVDFQTRRESITQRQWDRTTHSFIRVADNTTDVARQVRAIRNTSHAMFPGPDPGDLLSELVLSEIEAHPDSPGAKTIVFVGDVWNMCITDRIHGLPNSESRKLHEREVETTRRRQLYDQIRWETGHHRPEILCRGRVVTDAPTTISADNRGFWGTPIREQVGKLVYKLSTPLGDRWFGW